MGLSTLLGTLNNPSREEAIPAACYEDTKERAACAWIIPGGSSWSPTLKLESCKKTLIVSCMTFINPIRQLKTHGH